MKGQQELDSYLRKLRADRRCERTQKKHSGYLKQALVFIDKDPKEISIEDIERWKYEATVNRKYEAETVTHSFLILRKFLRFIGNNEVADKMEIPKHSRHVPPEKEIWLLPEEQEAMIKKSRELGIRTEAMIRLFLSTGIRVGELRQLELSDINFDEQTIQIRHGKGDKSRVVFFDTSTKNALLAYLKVRKEPNDGSQILFTSTYGTSPSYTLISRVVKECAVTAGIRKKITPHKLRHTFITTVIERTKDIPLAQKLAGHTEIATTMRYHHNTYEEVKAKYKEYFDSPKSLDTKPQIMKPEEILRALDTKYLRGEIPTELYMKLRKEYESLDGRERSKIKQISTKDPAYM
ncbi:MAG: tyrosine-type recombinase/integrase [Candidatus Thermoplasmatota archaeon]